MPPSRPPLPPGSVDGWYKVLDGLSRVASAASSRSVAQSEGFFETALLKHGPDVAANMRKAAARAAANFNATSSYGKNRYDGGDAAWNRDRSQGINIGRVQYTGSCEGSDGSVLAREKMQSGGSKSVKEERNHYDELEMKKDDVVRIAPGKECSPSVKYPDKKSVISTATASSATTGLNEDAASKLSSSASSSVESLATAGVAASSLVEDMPASAIAENIGSTPLEPEASSIGMKPESSGRMREGTAVPSTKMRRALGFATLGAGLAAGTIAEAASRMFGRGRRKSPHDEESSSGTSSHLHAGEKPKFSPVASKKNAERLAKSLGRMRGAALKLGQMLSIQDETLLPPALASALRQVVHQGADAMPRRQLEGQMEKELGQSWREKFLHFDNVPFAAASIGQVHRAMTPSLGNHATSPRSAVVKVQFPGVADSIESDLANLQTLVKLTGLAPPGLFIDEVIRVGREELKVECDYEREAKNQVEFKRLVEGDEVLTSERFVVPGVVSELSTKRVLTTDYAPGGTIDKVANLSQAERNRIGQNILRLTMLELFVWRFMQTDPNWGNFLYDVHTRTTSLIDFGAARPYDKSFVDGYLRIVWAAANGDLDTLMDYSHRLGFLTGDENDIMVEAHKNSGLVVGEPFAADGPYDFRRSGVTTRLSQHGSAFLQHRLTPPPSEVYTLHRKLSGAYMICIKLGAVISCRGLLEEIMENHQFDD